MRNWRARPRSQILYFPESMAFTSRAALVVSFGYNIEMSSMYKSIRVPSLRRERLWSAWHCVNSRESKMVLISLYQSRGAYLRPESAFFSWTMIIGVLSPSGQPSGRFIFISLSWASGLRTALTTSKRSMFQPCFTTCEMRYRTVVSFPTGATVSPKTVCP